MKNIIKSLIVIALVAVIGFSFVSCGGDDGDDTIPAKWLGTYQGVGIFPNGIDLTSRNCTLTIYNFRDFDYGDFGVFEFYDISNPYFTCEGPASVKSGGTIAGSLSGEYVYIFNDVRRMGILVNIPSERKIYAFFGARVSEIITEYELRGVTATPAISAAGIDAIAILLHSFGGYKQY